MIMKTKLLILLGLCVWTAAQAQPSPVVPASQAEVNAGTVTKKFVSPATLQGKPGGAGGTNFLNANVTNLYVSGAIRSASIVNAGAFQSDGGAITSDGLGVFTINSLNANGAPLGADIAGNAATATTLQGAAIINSPTNTAHFRIYGSNNFWPTGQRGQLDPNIGHHFIHVWGQYTNSLSTPVLLWLTNDTTHEVAVLGVSAGAVSPALTNMFNLELMCSGQDTISLTNKFTPGANAGVRIDGSTDNAW
jgi:hypothetical protein